MSSSDASRCRRIAVIAVHGVADQAPCATARQVADLLLVSGAKDVSYRTFAETPLRVAVRAVELPAEMPATRVARETPGSDDLKAFKGRFDESSQFVRECHARQRASGGRGLQAVQEDLDHQFMVEQLRGYEPRGGDAVYDTIRLDSQRLGGTTADGGAASEPRPEVHLFELYWSDLSRVGAGFLSIFEALYQLLFHLTDVGRQTIDYARIEHGERRIWRLFSEIQTWGARALTLPIALFNLYLLVIVLILITLGPLKPAFVPVLFWGLVGSFLVVWWGYAAFRRAGGNWITWRAPVFVLVAWAAGVFYLALQNGTGAGWPLLPYYRLLAGLEALGATALIWLLARQYAALRPGADQFVLVTWPVVLLFLFVMLVSAAGDGPNEVGWAGLATVEFIYGALSVSWIAFAVLQASAWLVGMVALWAIAGGDAEARAKRDRAARAIWTARLSLAFPSALFLLLTIVLWGGLRFAVSRPGHSLLPEDAVASPMWPGLLGLPPDEALPAARFFGTLIYASARAAFLSALGLTALAMLLAAWGLFPCVWAEIRSPSRSGDEKADRLQSDRLGSWLTNGMSLLVTAGNVLQWFVLLLPVGMVLDAYGRKVLTFPAFMAAAAQYVPKPDWAIEVLGGLVAASAAGLVAFRGRLDVLALGFRSVIDAATDVDNHLREHPRGRTPRARICARYASLLRHICQWRDPHDLHGYDAMVIVAHSQGAVITADLLRYLKREKDPTLGQLHLDPRSSPDAIRIYLFSVGCPLRQLYAVRFPHLYKWARPEKEDQGFGASPADIPAGQAPDPAALGVRRWVNGYRSGDYVGRFLWRTHPCDYRYWSPAQSDPKSGEWRDEPERPVFVSSDGSEAGVSRREFCVGAGAHTHYFDVEVASEVGRHLDFLIVEACREREHETGDEFG
jgi:hypothetical protein